MFFVGLSMLVKMSARLHGFGMPRDVSLSEQRHLSAPRRRLRLPSWLDGTFWESSFESLSEFIFTIQGSVCADPCPPKLWGPNCAYKCPECYNNGTCDRFSGSCQCAPGFVGVNCEQECSVGLWGLNCNRFCDCQFSANCDAKDGRCICNEFQSGSRCETLDCPEGQFGTSCEHSCKCEHNATCDVITGQCNCTADGFTGRHCNEGSIRYGQGLRSLLNL